MSMKPRSWLFPLVTVLTLASGAEANAEGGWYAGGSAGTAYLELDVEDGQGDVFAFDEGDTAWKVFAGRRWELPLLQLGVEAGYVDLASPVASFQDFDAEFEASGLSLWGVAGVDLGPVGVFAKAGALSWDIDGGTTGAIEQSFEEEGTDLGFGVGAKLALWSLELRAEYENYDIEDTKDVEMVSLGLVWVF